MRTVVMSETLILIDLLLSTRHKGAIEKTYEGYRVLCEKLLHSSSEELRVLPERWVSSLISMLGTATAVTRRSAGIPYCLTGILQAEAASRGPINHLLNLSMTSCSM